MRLFVVFNGAFLITAISVGLLAQNPDAKSAPVNETKGLPPRAGPSEYPSQAQAGKVTIAAEFMGHSLPRPEGPLTTEDYVVVETGFFGPAGEKINLTNNDFSLRINGKKAPLSEEPYGVVVSSLRDPAWSPPEEQEKKKSKGGLSTGGSQADSGPPPPVHIPIEMQRSMAKYAHESSLREGDRPLPEAGLIFFQYRGNTKKIHSIELIYSGAAGNATLELQP